ncbi:FIG026291: Hypothetical periplasmic protein [hydrothermal vent metagenome]|uniref:FIG026291: Hypothetical periplasmic protein n=1 Tax=hydrothermal vent metagenome TaxID=652676 RepID=A0A3B1AA65_9ZZZZ
MDFIKIIKASSDKLMLSLTVLLASLIYSQNSISSEIAGVKIPDSIQSGNVELILNGVGIRTKFFFDIYIGSLYLKVKESNAEKIINSAQTKRINLHFLYKEVNKEKLTNGWTAGFKNNNTPEIFTILKQRLEKFNSFFKTMHNGDSVQFDFINAKSTKITINNTLQGEINGVDFQKALLRVWLGEDPADSELKQALLGISEN